MVFVLGVSMVYVGLKEFSMVYVGLKELFSCFLVLHRAENVFCGFTGL